jgi:hypothetical protein
LLGAERAGDGRDADSVRELVGRIREFRYTLLFLARGLYR